MFCFEKYICKSEGFISFIYLSKIRLFLLLLFKEFDIFIILVIFIFYIIFVGYYILNKG